MNNLQILMNGVFGRKVPAEFAAADYDYEAALHDELVKLLCDDKGKFSRSKYRRNKVELFELLEQNLEEVLPRSVGSALDMFCEIIHVGQGDRLEFRVTKGKQRGRQFVTRATESGNYETFRLDRDRFDIWTQAIGGAGYVDFERYLDGVENMSDIYEVIQQGIVDRIFEMVQEALLQTWNLAGRPAANKVVATNFDPAAMVKLCNTVAAYGAPVIYCTPEFAAEMTNAIVYASSNPSAVGVKISDVDMQEVRDRGYIGKFRGVPVVVLPQSFTDEFNTKTVMNPSFAYVMPTGQNNKIVKLGFEGSPYFREWDDHEGDNSIDLQGYVKCGVAVVGTPNYWGIYYNAAIDAGEWEAYNMSLLSAAEKTAAGKN
jgi:hypothetical protein